MGTLENDDSKNGFISMASRTIRFRPWAPTLPPILRPRPRLHRGRLPENNNPNRQSRRPTGRRTSTFERGCVDDVAYVRNLETMHETPPDVGQASTNRRMRLLSCDFGQSFCECCFHSDPRLE